MTKPLDDFMRDVSDSGLLPDADLRAWLDTLPADSRPQDGEQLARELVKHKRLTKFQAEQLYAGKGKSLTLGNYVILDKLGQGGMGVVLKAEHKRLKRLVALKVMSPAAVKSADALKRFHREVEAAAKLRHPNVVATDDADEAKGTHFLVMEYVEGSDLSVLVKKHGPLPPEQAVRCIIQAARGLEFAHEQGVIHRDIKPANLLIDAKGTVKILDMGLARIDGEVGGSSEGAGLTNTGTIMGTVDYMSPEQAMDTKHADARSDIYSLGCSLYYLLTGKVVYDGDTMMKKLMAHQHTAIPELGDALRSRNRQISDVRDETAQHAEHGSLTTSATNDLDVVFRRMVAKKPEDRPQSMTEVIAELERCLSGGTPTVVFERSGSSATNVAAGGASGSGNELQDFLRQISGGEPVTATSSKASGTLVTPSSGEAETMISSAGDGGTDPRTEQTVTVNRSGEPMGVSPRTVPRGKLIAALTSVGLVLLAVFIWSRISGTPDSGPNVASKGSGQSGSPTATTSSPESAPPSAIRPQAGERTPSREHLALDFNVPLAEGVARVELPDVLEMAKPCTIEFFVTPRSHAPTNTNRKLFAINRGLALKQYEAGWQWIGDVTTEVIYVPESVQLQQRAHIAGVSTGNELRLFANGKLLRRLALTQPLGPGASYSTIGGQHSAMKGWEPLDALIDQFRMSAVARYDQDFTPPDRMATDNDTLILYNFDEGQGDKLTDSSGNNHHGKIVGAKWVRRDVGLSATPANALGKLTQSDKWLELVTSVDAMQDLLPEAQVGKNQWDNRDGVLTYVSDGRAGFIRVPVEINSREVELEIEMTPLEDNAGLSIDVPTPEHLVVFQLLTNGDGRAALSAKVHGEPMAFVKGQKSVAKLRFVSQPGAGGTAEATMTFNGKAVIEWKGKLEEVNFGPLAPGDRDLLQTRSVGLWVGNKAMAFHSIRVRVPDGNARLLRLPPAAKAPFDAKQARAHQEAWAKHLGTTVETTNSVGAKMILIPPGEFRVGSTDEQVAVALKWAEEVKADEATTHHIQSAERPQYRVVITKPFVLCATEVTAGQFQRFVSATGYQTDEVKAANEPNAKPNRSPTSATSDELPAAMISWNDAVAYCQWLTTQEKTTYRLPTEAEWEYACRAGTTTQYSCGDDLNQLNQFAWYDQNAGGTPHRVGTKLPNAFGLHDMHGNMQEWCQDHFGRTWYETAPTNDPTGPESSQWGRVSRGGNWFSNHSYCRSTHRINNQPAIFYRNFGFRVIRELGAPAVTPDKTR